MLFHPVGQPFDNMFSWSHSSSPSYTRISFLGKLSLAVRCFFFSSWWWREREEGAREREREREREGEGERERGREREMQTRVQWGRVGFPQIEQSMYSSSRSLPICVHYLWCVSRVIFHDAEVSPLGRLFLKHDMNELPEIEHGKSLKIGKPMKIQTPI